MIITFPTNTREIINAIRSGIGRTITFYREVKTPCSGCSIDPITDTSTDSFCIICNGNGYVYSYSGYPVLAHITHGPINDLDWRTGGQIFLGDGKVQIEYTQANDEITEDAKYVVVDQLEFTIDTKNYRGVPELNRIVLDLKKR